jgi:uncharacterized protein YifE (UPF0438 family)
LKRRNFDLFDIPIEQFTPDEWSFLREYGNWLEALGLGLISPITDLQSNFIEVINNRREPSTFEERVWIKYLDWDRRVEKPGVIREGSQVKWWFERPKRIEPRNRVGIPHKLRHLNGDLPHTDELP